MVYLFSFAKGWGYKPRVSLRIAILITCSIFIGVYMYVIVCRISYCRRMARAHQEAVKFWEESLSAIDDPSLHDDWDERFFFKNKELKDSVLRTERHMELIKKVIDFHSNMSYLFEKSASNPWFYLPPQSVPPAYEKQLLYELTR